MGKSTVGLVQLSSVDRNWQALINQMLPVLFVAKIIFYEQRWLYGISFSVPVPNEPSTS
jgi:hypothetical protein